MKVSRLAAAVAAFAGLAAGPFATAQPTDEDAGRTISFAEYMAAVDANNRDVAAARLAIPVAAAEFGLARRRPDPTLTVGLAQLDVSGEGAPTSSFVGAAIPFEVGGERRRRLELAGASVELAEAELERVRARIRADAAIAYVDALEAALVLAVQQGTLVSLDRMVEANVRRHERGDVGEATVLRSRIAAQRFRADLLVTSGEVRAANLALAIFASESDASAVGLRPHGTLDVARRPFDEADLLARARTLRPDLAASEGELRRAALEVEVARADRVVDLALNVGWTHNAATDEPQFRQEANDTLGVTLTLPLPFSNRHRGTVDAAVGARAQAEMERDATRLRVALEVRRAFARYEAAADRVAAYETGIVDDSERVVAQVELEQARGEASLDDVLAARRSHDEIRIAYVRATADHVRALIELEAAVGLWDIAL